MREALLAEAYHRLHDWFLNKDWVQKPPPYGRLDWPKEENGVQLQITTTKYPCDTEEAITKMEAGLQEFSWDSSKPKPTCDNIPITFGRFDVEGVEPIDVFNALSDTAAQKEWDTLVGDVSIIGDFEIEAARAATLTFVAHPFPDREIFQWMVYNATKDNKDMIVVYSTRRNDVLHQLKAQAPWPTVMAHNCLGAYQVVALPQGGSHVIFTSMVNSHPPWPITAEFVFNLLWTKTAEYIFHLRDRAQLMKKQRLARGETVGTTLLVPRWLVYDGESPDPTQSGSVTYINNVSKTIPPYAGLDYVADVAAYFQIAGYKFRRPDARQMHILAVGLFACVTFSFGALVVYRRRRSLETRMTVLSTSDEVEDGEHALLSTFE